MTVPQTQNNKALLQASVGLGGMAVAAAGAPAVIVGVGVAIGFAVAGYGLYKYWSSLKE
jgi:hypothetical protein